MNAEEMQAQAREHVRRWYEVLEGDATMETTINALMLIIAAIAESAPRRQVREAFLRHMANFIADLRADRVILKKINLQ